MSRRAAAPAAPPAPSGARISTVKSQLQAERRWLMLMRVAFASGGVSWLLLIAWALPWTPVGQVATDPDTAGALGLLFAIAAIGTTLAFRAVWWPTFRDESLRDFAGVLFGGQLLIRRPMQFLSRLDTECRQARRGRVEPFSLIIVELAEAPANRRGRPSRRGDEASMPALLVRSIARGDDQVGDGAPNRVWLLAAAADETVQDRVVQRVTAALSSAPFIGSAERCRIGASTFGPDGQRATELLSGAEARLAPVAASAKARQAA